MAENEQNNNSGFATASLTLGIIGICLAPIAIINGLALILDLLAIIFGIVALIMKGRKGKAIGAIIISIIAIIITINRPGGVSKPSNTVQNNATTTQQTNSEENIEGKGTIRDFGVEIKDYTITSNSRDEKVLLVKIAFTNNDNEPKAFNYNLDCKAYQNGIELKTPFSSYDIDGLDWEDKTKKIKPGVTYEFNMGYCLDNETSDVEVEISPTFFSKYSQKVKKTFKIVE